MSGLSEAAQWFGGRYFYWHTSLESWKRPLVMA